MRRTGGWHLASITTSALLVEGAALSLSFGQPARHLAPFVRNFWEVRSDVDGACDQAFPTEEAAIVLNLGATQMVNAGAAQWSRWSGAWLVGPQTSVLNTRSPAGTWVMGARLTPRGLSSCLRLPSGDAAFRMIPLQDLFGNHAGLLQERVATTQALEDGFELFASALHDRFDADSAWLAEIDQGLRWLRDTGGTRPIGEIAHALGWSRQRFHRIFSDSVGLSPKSTARLIRLKKVIDVIGYDQNVRLADIAQVCGFFDQAHFARDFASFTGLTPGQYLTQRWPSSLETLSPLESGCSCVESDQPDWIRAAMNEWQLS